MMLRPVTHHIVGNELCGIESIALLWCAAAAAAAVALLLLQVSEGIKTTGEERETITHHPPQH